MKTVHIGLGKTSTKTLQRGVFPVLSEMRPNINYNPHNVRLLFIRAHLYKLADNEKNAIKKYLEENDEKLISLEALVNWNPRYWERAADRNLEIFGKDANIIITVRDTSSYLTSMYQQSVASGNVIKPENFFLKRATYDAIQDQIPGSLIPPVFDVDSFDLVRLKNIYEERFDSVYMIPVSEVEKMNFLREIYDLKKEEVEVLRDAYKSFPRQNVAYSDIGMKITFMRERLLNLLDAKSIDVYNQNPLAKYYSLGYSGPTKE